MTEAQLEQDALGWLTELGYTHRYGPDIAHDGAEPQRAHYRQVLLPFRLREAIQRLNPAVPTAAREDALQQVSRTKWKAAAQRFAVVCVGLGTFRSCTKKASSAFPSNVRSSSAKASSRLPPNDSVLA